MKLDLDSVWCVIPVYNNAATVRDVVMGCRAFLSQVLVIDDGSTDADLSLLLAGTGAAVVRHQKNQGKGRALLTALNYVSEKQGRFMITIDGDGQHHPADLQKFFPLLEEDENSLIIGCRDFSAPNIPGKSRFGRDFANFWLRIETGQCVGDCQSGFRAYPVKHFKQLRFTGSHYDFETEALTRAAWAGLSLKQVDIGVYYPEEGKRVSSFRPFKDNARISWMHTRLILRHLLPLPHHKLVSKPEMKFDLSFFKHPVPFLKKLMKENASPVGLGASAGVGIILATLPLMCFHTITILYVTARLHLNKIMAVSIQNLCMPPLVPLMCIELGHYLRYGQWITSVSKEAFLGQIPDLMWDWFIGSLIVAPVLAVIVGMAVYAITMRIRKKHGEVSAFAGTCS